MRHRRLLADAAGVSIHRYELLREIVAAAEGWQMFKDQRRPADEEARLAAQEAVKLLDTRDPGKIALACARFRNRLGAVPQTTTTLPAVRAAIARQAGLAAGFADMQAPTAPLSDLREIDKALTRAIHELTMFRKRIRAELTAREGSSA